MGNFRPKWEAVWEANRQFGEANGK